MINEGQTENQYDSLVFSEPGIGITGDMPCHYALSIVLLQNLNILQENEAGIREDKDIECLHHFRVGGRRSRSILNRLKHVYPESRITRFKKAFSWMSDFTGRHRDLDIFLSNSALYEKNFTGSDYSELNGLYVYLQKLREQEHLRLINSLDSKRYESFKINWHNFLVNAIKQPFNTANSSAPIIEIVNQSIWSNYRKLIKQKKKIKSEHDYTEIHKLRITTKKLRYLLDSFYSIYDSNEITRIINILKKLQNNMGDVVDMHNQQVFIEQWKETLQRQNKLTYKKSDIFKKLEMICDNKKNKAMKKFFKQFNTFSAKPKQALFRKVFH